MASSFWSPPAAAQVGNACISNGISGIYSATPNIETSLYCSSGTWVASAFQIGSTAASCSSTTAGAIEYTSSTFEGCNGTSWITLGGGSGPTITLGTAASATNPQRSGEAGTGLFSAASGQVSIAVSESGTGTEVGRFTSTGLNIIAPVTASTDEPSLQINGNNAIWQDATNFNVAVGLTALPTTVSQAGGGVYGQSNTAVGYGALNANTTGFKNVALGYGALTLNTTGYGNVAMGYNALGSNTTGSNSTALGYGAMGGNTTGGGTALGYKALNANTIGTGNTALGYGALGSNTTGSNSTAVGTAALAADTTGEYNTALGYQAGYDVTTGGQNIIIGYYPTTGVGITTGSNNILIGQNLQELTQTSSNQLDIGNLIFATGLANGSTMSTGNVGIGTASPAAELEVSGTNSNVTYLTIGRNSGANSIGNYEALDFRNTDASGGILAAAGRISNVLEACCDQFGLAFSTMRYGAVLTESMRLSSTGNVGIGSTSPVSSLDISQKTDAVALPSGTSVQRPSGVNGMIRYSQTNSALEGYINGAWESLVTGTGSTSSITLGTAASATNPQRSSEAGTGLFSANSGQVSIAVSESGTGTEVGRFTSTGLNIIAPVTASTDEPSLQINGNNAIWQDATHANIAVGPTALPSTVSQSGGGSNGQGNVAIGYHALNVNTTGIANTAVGTNALALNTIGTANVAIGDTALYANTTGNANTAIGYYALVANTTGIQNTAVGDAALYANTTGIANTAIGVNALVGTTNSNNTAIGYNAGYDISSGGQNIIIGYYPTTGVGVSTGSDNILIGQDVRPPSQTSSNQLNIGNLIYATGLGTGSTLSTGSVGIGTTSPTAKLQVLTTSETSATTIVSFDSEYLAIGPSTTDAVAISKTSGGTGYISSVTLGSQWDPLAINVATFAVNPNAGSTALFVNTNGNVGIGTTSPNSEFDVIKNGTGLSMDPGNGTSIFGTLGFNRETATGTIFSSNAYAYQFAHTGSTTNTSDYLALQVYNPSGADIDPSALVVNGAGYIGIGTTSPNSTLAIVNNDAANKYGVVGIGDGSQGNTVNLLRLSGQMNPSSGAWALDIEPTLQYPTGFNFNGIYIKQTTAASATSVNLSGIYIDNPSIGGAAANRYAIYAADTDQSYFAGNVGIGSTSPVSSLDLSQKTDAVALPSGTSAQRPSAVNGMIRYSQTNSALEGYINGAWESLVTGTGSTSSINLGTAASATNPQRSSEAGTGLFSAASGQVSVAVSESGIGTEVGRFTSTGLNIIAPVTVGTDEPSLQINGNNAIWQDVANANLVVGASAFPSSVTTGTAQYNVAIGQNALNANTTGTNNVAIGGYGALAFNTTGYNNTVVGGSFAMYRNTTGINNTAVGATALNANTTGNSNSAFGSSAIRSTSGSDNTAIGALALVNLGSGGGNVALGGYTGASVVTGSNNILIAADTPQSTDASNTLNIGNAIYGTGLGGTVYIGIGTASPSYTLHVNGSVAGTSAYNNLSDARLKTDIVEITNGLELVQRLKAIHFRWKTPENRTIGKSLNLPVDTPQLGFLAQDVKAVVPEAVVKDSNGIYSMEETKLIPVLVEAVKELETKNEKLSAQVGSMAAELKQFKDAGPAGH